jgi:hypothetical protein
MKLLSLGLIALYLGLVMEGCAAKRQVGTNLLIAPECLKKPVEMLGCDDMNPPKCRKALISYKKGCEVVEAAK